VVLPEDDEAYDGAESIVCVWFDGACKKKESCIAEFIKESVKEKKLKLNWADCDSASEGEEEEEPVQVNANARVDFNAKVNMTTICFYFEISMVLYVQLAGF
jgi:hypothetical protein